MFVIMTSCVCLIIPFQNLRFVNIDLFIFRTDLVPENNLQSILKAFQVETVDEEYITKLLVLRSDVLNMALKGLNRRTINFKSSLYVKFSGELGGRSARSKERVFQVNY